MESNDQLHRTLDDALRKTHSILDAFTTMKQYVSTLETSYRKLEASYQQKCKEYDEYVINHSEFNKVSFVSQLNRQLKEKDQQIADLQTRLAKIREPRTPASLPLSEPAIVAKVVPTVEPVVSEVVSPQIPKPEEPQEKTEEEPEEEVSENEETDEDDEPAITYETVKLGKKYYYVSNESPQGIYEVQLGPDGNEVGEQIGTYVNQQSKWFPGKEPVVSPTDKKKKAK